MQRPFETQERRAFRDSVLKLIETDIAPFADDWDEAGDVPWDLHEKVGALGIFALGVPEEHGGLGFDDVFMRAAYSEELGRVGAGGISAPLVAARSRSTRLCALRRTTSSHAPFPTLLPGARGHRSGSPSLVAGLTWLR